MKTFSFNFLCVFLVLTFFFSASSFAFQPPLSFEKAKEESEIDELYRFPMIALKGVLNKTREHCKRLPDEKEFRDFILQGSSPNIYCSQKIKGFSRSPRFNDAAFGKDIPKLPELLKMNQLQVFSDTKTLLVILRQNAANWKFKHFKREELEMVIDCPSGDTKCHLIPMDLQIRSCRNNKSYAKRHCFFGGKKIIDYD